MEKWYRLNLGFTIGGILLVIISIIFVREMPLFLCSAMFGVGITFKSIKNIIKKETPNQSKKIKKSNYTSNNRKSK